MCGCRIQSTQLGKHSPIDTLGLSRLDSDLTEFEPWEVLSRLDADVTIFVLISEWPALNYLHHLPLSQNHRPNSVLIPISSKVLMNETELGFNDVLATQKEH